MIASTAREKWSALATAAGKPAYMTAVTFGPISLDAASDILTLATSTESYSQGLYAAVHAGYGYRSANLGEYQLTAIVRPGDLWACVAYTKAKPVVIAGTYGELQTSLQAFHRAGRFYNAERTPVDVLFYQLEIDLIASIF